METSRTNPVTLVGAKAVKGGKISLEFTQMVQRPNSSTSLTSLANASDERFNQSKPRHAWIVGEKSDFSALFGIDFSSLAEGESIDDINMVEPIVNGQMLNIGLIETTKATDWQLANLEKSAKRAGKDGDYIVTDKGDHIFTNPEVFVGEAKHYSFPNTKRVAVGGDVTSAVASAIEE
jgi:hypothetical protein